MSITSTTERLHQFLSEFKKDQLGEIESAAAKGDADACFELGALYANGLGVKQNSPQARKWLKKAIAQDVTAARTLLAWLYLNDESLGQADTDAIQLFLEAAEADDSDAQCSLGDLYLEGAAGIEPNPKAMLQWYSSAANHNHPKAQYMLGKLLAEGKRVQQNDEAAFQWLTLAIMNQSEPAQKELALLTARLSSEDLEQYKQRMMDSMPQTH
ncbi:MAG: tetratricopeptide repeat protein [Pseudomonadota bacterium]